ncbi:helix-turn-helix domain-containing protein [Mycobacterium sp.]|uniref:helix-turn-helix transcriptional regulator n=1 Tax=Mycobacterium sp. TaxID=1785 RepID=UPI001228196E|nr:MAG: DNA-binding protein [Mycobacterium sp.]
MLLRKSEVASKLRVTERTVDRWIHDGALPALRYGSRTVRIDSADLDAFGRSAAVNA